MSGFIFYNMSGLFQNNLRFRRIWSTNWSGISHSDNSY